MSLAVTMEDIRAAGYCWNGTSAFMKQHGLTKSRLKRGEITVDELRGLNDIMANKVCDAAERRVA